MSPEPQAERTEVSSSGAAEQLRAIVVPLDGSSLAEVALREAAHLAPLLGAAVHLFSAVAKTEDVERRAEALRGSQGERACCRT